MTRDLDCIRLVYEDDGLIHLGQFIDSAKQIWFVECDERRATVNGEVVLASPSCFVCIVEQLRWEQLLLYGAQ